jgi:hypothetical protein
MQAGATGADNDDDPGPTVAWTADFEQELGDDHDNPTQGDNY